MENEPRITRKYTVQDIDRMRDMLSRIDHNHVFTENTLRTYLMAGISPDELERAIDEQREKRKETYVFGRPAFSYPTMDVPPSYYGRGASDNLAGYGEPDGPIKVRVPDKTAWSDDMKAAYERARAVEASHSWFAHWVRVIFG